MPRGSRERQITNPKSVRKRGKKTKVVHSQPEIRDERMDSKEKMNICKQNQGTDKKTKKKRKRKRKAVHSQPEMRDERITDEEMGETVTERVREKTKDNVMQLLKGRRGKET